MSLKRFFSFNDRVGQQKISEYLYFIFAVLVLLVVSVIPSFYDRAEDAIIHQAAAGRMLSNQPTQYIYWTHIFFGYITKYLYSNWPSVEWYPSLMKALLVFTGGFAFFIGRDFPPNRRSIFFVVNMFFLVTNVVFMQFTQTAGYLACVGCLGFLFYLSFQKRPALILMPSIVLSIFGFLYRPEMAMMCGLIFAIGVSGILCNLWALAGLIAKRLFVGSVLFVLLFQVFGLFVEPSLYSDPSGWQNYRSSLNKIGSFTDYYEVYDRSNLASELKNIGWSEHDWALIRFQIACDSTVMTTDKMQTFYSGQQRRSISVLIRSAQVPIEKAFRAISNHWHIAALLLLIVLASSVDIFRAGAVKAYRDIVVTIAPLFGLLCAVIATAVWFQRLQPRVLTGYLFSSCCALFTIYLLHGQRGPKKNYLGWLILVFSLATIIPVVFEFRDIGLRLRSAYLAKDEVLDEYRQIIQVRKMEPIIFLMIGGAKLEAIWPWDYDKIPITYSNSHLIAATCLGGDFPEQLSRQNIGNIFAYISDTKIPKYFVIKSPELSVVFEKFIREHYNTNFSFEEAYRGRNLTVFRTVSK